MYMLRSLMKVPISSCGTRNMEIPICGTNMETSPVLPRCSLYVAFEIIFFLRFTETF